MNNTTAMKIYRPAHAVFEAFIDPSQIGNFWFSSSSERWAQGKTITLAYEEYDAKGDIRIIEIEPEKKIAFRWGAGGEGRLVTITLKEADRATLVEVVEEGFHEHDPQFLSHVLDNKEGWVYTLTCLKGYLEYGVTKLRAALIK